jgi:ATP-dependent 26S proteasome regulatory subunit
LKIDKDIPKIFFKDIGGIDEIINEIKEMIIYPIKFGHVFQTIGVKSPKGILLSGPPGSGKTSLGIAICNEMDRPFKKITGTEIVSNMSGESEV